MSIPNVECIELFRNSALASGTLIADRYLIETLIGEGGMGRVYRATQLSLDRPIALKLLHGPRPTSAASRQRFAREARVASAVHHRNAVKVYDAGQDGPIAYIAMELLTGHELGSLLDNGSLPLPDLLEITIQVADLLRMTHAIPLVHRDLKPGNIFIERDDGGRLRVRVLDFGLAFIEGSHDGRMTQPGMLVGTPAFLAPEQALATEVGPAADIYSLGCVMYQMLTGHRVFRGSQNYILTQHIYVQPVGPRACAPDANIPPPLDALVVRMLAKCPRDRPTAAQLHHELITLRDSSVGELGRRPNAPKLEGRASRMISTASPRIDDATALERYDSSEELLRVGIFGEFDDSVWLGMPINGLLPSKVEEPDPLATSSCDVVVTSCLDLERIRAWVAKGLPVVVVVRGPSVSVGATLLRHGVSEMLAGPCRVDDLVRKIRRSVRRIRRQRTKGR